MEVLLVLTVSFTLLRGVGWLGVERLSSWRAAGRGALVAMLLFTGTSHFTGMKHDFAAMIPDPLPNGLWVIYLSGLFEIAGAVGLLIPRTRKLAGILLTLLLAAMFPANVSAALNGIPFGGEAPTPLWLRAPMQLLFIAMLWWTSISFSKEAGRPRVKGLADEHKQPLREGAREGADRGRAGLQGRPRVDGGTRAGMDSGTHETGRADAASAPTSGGR